MVGSHQSHRQRARTERATRGGRVLAITAVLALPASEDVAKYAPHPVVIGVVGTVALLVVVSAALALLDRARFRAVAGAPPVTVLLLLGIAAGSFALRHFEQRRVASGLGSTAAPALVRPDLALLHGHTLYSVHLAGGVPISPGPLWLLANVAFSVRHLFPLLLPFWIAVVVVVLRWALHRPAEVAVGLALLCCSSHFWVMLAEGQDLLVTAGVMVALFALVHRVAGRSGCSDAAAVLLGLAAAVVATTRFIYLPLPIALGWCLSRREGARRSALIVAAVGTVVAVAANGVAAVGVHPYQPVHLFSRADHREPAWNLVLGALCTLAVITAAWRRVGPGVRTWLWWLGCCLGVAQLFVSAGELEGLHFHVARWEASNYLFTAAPAVIAGMIATLRRPAVS